MTSVYGDWTQCKLKTIIFIPILLHFLLLSTCRCYFFFFRVSGVSDSLYSFGCLNKNIKKFERCKMLIEITLHYSVMHFSVINVTCCCQLVRAVIMERHTSCTARADVRPSQSPCNIMLAYTLDFFFPMLYLCHLKNIQFDLPCHPCGEEMQAQQHTESPPNNMIRN